MSSEKRDVGMKGKWDIGWGIEIRCNMNCEFCYSKEVRQPGSEINGTVYKNFIDKNADYISSINYGTGENALSEEWFQIVEYIGKNYPSIRQALTTNGYISAACQDSKKLEIFSKHIDEVDISLDFAQRERHNKFRGNPDAYDMAIAAFKLCSDYKKQTTLVFLGTNEVVQHHNLEGLFEIAHKHHAYLRTNIYRPTQGIDEKTQKYVLDYSSLLEMLKWVSNNHKVIKVSDRLLAAVLFQEKVEDFTGYSSLRILGDGSITPSTYLISEKYRKYNISDNVLLNEMEFSKEIARECIPKRCLDCSIGELCRGGTFDRRLLWYGTLDEQDPYCPHRHQEADTKGIVLSADKNFNSIHDSYLPTMFFAY